MEGNGEQGNNPAGEGTPDNGNNQNTPPSYELAGWTAGLSNELKEQYGAELAKFENPSDFAQMAFDAQDRLSRAIVRPKEGASEEEVAAYRESIGMPGDANSYELKAEGSGTKAFIEGFKALAFERNLSSETAQAVVDFFVQTEKAAGEAMATELKNIQENSQKELMTEWGSNYEPKMLKTNQMVAVHFGEEFAKFLEDSKLGNDARFIRGMAAMAEKISEDDLDNPPGGGEGEKTTGFSFKNTPGMH